MDRRSGRADDQRSPVSNTAAFHLTALDLWIKTNTHPTVEHDCLFDSTFSPYSFDVMEDDFNFPRLRLDSQQIRLIKLQYEPRLASSICCNMIVHDLKPDLE
jgi:hypothetical protein